MLLLLSPACKWGKACSDGGLAALGKRGPSAHLACFTGSLFSVFPGMAALLSLAIATFTQEPQLCLNHLAQRGSLLMSTLKHLLSPSFLYHLGQA